MMLYRRANCEGASYFFTVVTEQRRPIFRDAWVVALFESSLARIRVRHHFDVEAYVILPDHIHFIWTLPNGDANFSMRWRLIKEAFTKSYLRDQLAPKRSASRQSKGEQAIWQRRFWEHVIRDERDYASHVDYIHYNPVRHGHARAVRDWPHSSFFNWVERGVYEPHWGSDKVLPLPEWADRCE
jgi:putative transposase